MTALTLSQPQLNFIREIRATIDLCYLPDEKVSVRMRIRQLIQSNPFHSKLEVFSNLGSAAIVVNNMQNRVKGKKHILRPHFRKQLVYLLQNSIQAAIDPAFLRDKTQSRSENWEKVFAEFPVTLYDNIVVCSKTPNTNFLGHAAYHGAAETVERLIKNSCSTHLTFMSKISYGQFNIEGINESAPPLFLAAGSPVAKVDDKISVVKLLLSAKANVLQQDVEGNFWLAKKCSSIPFKVLELLMESIEDVSLTKTILLSDEGEKRPTSVLAQYIEQSCSILQTESEEVCARMRSSIENAAKLLIFHGLEVPENLQIKMIDLGFCESWGLVPWPAFRELLLKTSAEYQKIRDQEFTAFEARLAVHLPSSGVVSLITGYINLKEDQSLRVLISKRCLTEIAEPAFLKR